MNVAVDGEEPHLECWTGTGGERKSSLVILPARVEVWG